MAEEIKEMGGDSVFANLGLSDPGERACGRRAGEAEGTFSKGGAGSTANDGRDVSTALPVTFTGGRRA